MKDEEIWEILVDWNLWGNFDQEFRKREFYMSRALQLLKGKEIVVLKGVRRSGKSSLGYLILRELVKDGVFRSEDTLVINFEDPRFPSKLDARDLMKIYEVYLRKINPKRRHIILLDEIQIVEKWEKFARFLMEAKGVKVMITGSSSKLMSEEYASVLTGRHLDIEVFPLNFKEFLEWHGIKINDRIEIAKRRYEIQNLLEKYLSLGGFPEVTLAEKPRKIELLRRYLDDIITKDVAKRFNIREVEKLENLVKSYISNISTLQSFNKLRKVVGLSLDSVERFSKYLEISRLLFFVPKFGYSIKQQILSPKKVYVIDPGFYSIAGFRFMENVWRLMKNLVALELLRKQVLNPMIEIFYWRDQLGREVDFVVKEGLKIKQLIQVCYDIAELETKKREIRALIKASKQLKCKDLLCITWDYEAEEEIAWRGVKRKIKFIPLWKWLGEI